MTYYGTGEEIPTPFGHQVTNWAKRKPDDPAIIFYPAAGESVTYSWQMVDRRSNQIARLLAEHGVNGDAHVVIGLPNCPEHYLVTIAAWKLGALVIPIRAKLPKTELDPILELANPTVMVAEWETPDYPQLTLADVQAVDHYADSPHPPIAPHPGKALASGGSTGRSKLIVDPNPLESTEDAPVFGMLGMVPEMVHLVAGPLYHNAPFLFSHRGFFIGHTLILMGRFDAARAADLIEQHQISYAYMAPIMMSRIAKLPGVHERNLRSMRTLLHTAAPCPIWLKRAWFDLIGPEGVLELYAATEAVGVATIRGDEWLLHEGSVGQPVTGCEARILDPYLEELPRGEVGEIFMRWTEREGSSYAYIGSNPAKMDKDGFSSVGDLGWMDDEGYLFIADRRVDMIVSGGANVFPAEVEAVLTEHEAIADVAVIGIPDEEWGKRVHAVIQFKDEADAPEVADLDAYCRQHLMSYKVPKTYDFMEQLPRNSAGKLRRTALINDRAAGLVALISAQ